MPAFGSGSIRKASTVTRPESALAEIRQSIIRGILDGISSCFLSGSNSTYVFVTSMELRHFYGTSENAVKTQIWTAVCVYVLAAIVRKELALDVSLYTFLQVLSVHLSRICRPISQAFSNGNPSYATGHPGHYPTN
jgi:hypothetical protein